MTLSTCLLVTNDFCNVNRPKTRKSLLNLAKTLTLEEHNLVYYKQLRLSVISPSEEVMVQEAAVEIVEEAAEVVIKDGKEDQALTKDGKEDQALTKDAAIIIPMEAVVKAAVDTKAVAKVVAADTEAEVKAAVAAAVAATVEMTTVVEVVAEVGKDTTAIATLAETTGGNSLNVQKFLNSRGES
jgi:hypothetical protein